MDYTEMSWGELYRETEKAYDEIQSIYKEVAKRLGGGGIGQVNAKRDAINAAVLEITKECEPCRLSVMSEMISKARVAWIELTDIGMTEMDRDLHLRIRNE